MTTRAGYSWARVQAWPPTVQAAAEDYLHGKNRIRVLWEIGCPCKTTVDILGPKVWRGLIETSSDFGVESHRLNRFMTWGAEVKASVVNHLNRAK